MAIDEAERIYDGLVEHRCVRVARGAACRSRLVLVTLEDEGRKGARMEIIEGRASRVRSAIDVGGERDDASVHTTHITLFELGSRAVRVSSSDPVVINDGDEVRVAGVARSDAFYALAYRNLSTSSEGDQGWLAALILGTMLGVLGLGLFAQSFRGGNWWVLAIIGGILAAAGSFFAYRGVRVLAALGVLRRKQS
jgi:hypothetical protein